METTITDNTVYVGHIDENDEYHDESEDADSMCRWCGAACM
jgi:hypothetical protein